MAYKNFDSGSIGTVTYNNGLPTWNLKLTDENDDNLDFTLEIESETNTEIDVVIESFFAKKVTTTILISEAKDADGTYNPGRIFKKIMRAIGKILCPTCL